MKKLLFLALLFTFNLNAGEIQTDAEFGPNPGNLLMKKYIPKKVRANAPMVVLLHGCLQSAEEYASSSGWAKLAEENGFYLLLPSQTTGNNGMRCFTWFENADITRDQGEIYSIHNMIKKMISTHSIDTKKVFVTGLSAGASMTGSLLAVYPETFNAGAIVAGIPHGCARAVSNSFMCMFGFRTGSVESWKNEVLKEAPNYTGQRPRVSIWQGANDQAVKPVNATELVEQWTSVHGINQEATKKEVVEGHDRFLYQNAKKETLVEMYMISGASHGQPISPGNAPTDCGSNGQYFVDANICAAYHIGKFFNIVK
jgi:poly(hydroxyalkanoate) depolymerase family esterase